MKKKCLTILLVCGMISQFCLGCKSTESVTESVTKESTEAIEVSKESMERPVTVDDAVQTTQENEEEETEFSVGSVKNNVYTNDFFGFEFEPGVDYSFADAFLLQMGHNAHVADNDPSVMDDFEDATVEAVINDGHTVNIMYSANADATQKVWIDVMYDRNIASLMRILEYESAMDLLQNPLKKSLVENGYMDISVSMGQAVFMGDIVPTIDALATNNEKPYYIRHVFVEKDDYIAIIRVVSGTDFDDTQVLLKLFAQYGEEIVENSHETDLSNISPMVGYVEDNIYTNTTMNIQCNLDDEWEYWSVSMLEVYNGMSFDAESIESIMGDGQSVCVAAASTENGGSIHVLMRRTEVLFDYYTLEEIHKLNEEELRLRVTEMWSQWGYTNIELEIESVNFLDETLPCYKVTALTPEGPICQTQVMYPYEGYYMIITVTHDSPESTQEVLDCFSVYDE